MDLLREITLATWSRRGLEDAGYAGFCKFGALGESRPPKDPGIYVLLREVEAAPVFLERCLATKRECFTVDVSLLEREWIPGAKPSTSAWRREVSGRTVSTVG